MNLKKIASQCFEIAEKFQRNQATKNVAGLALIGLLAAIFAALCQPTPPDTNTNNPPMVWHAEGTTEDSTGALNQTKGAVSYAQGVSGQAFELDGKSQAIQTKVDTNPETHPSMTWSAWVLPRKIVGRRQILSSDNGNHKRSILLDNDRFTIFTGGNLWQTPEIVTPGAWQHIAVVFEPGQIRLYKNGMEYVYQISPAPLDPVAPAPLNIGGSPAFGEHFAGLIDEVEIHNRALSPEEISESYENLRTAAESILQENLENTVLYDGENGSLKANLRENVTEADAATQEKWAKEAAENAAQEEARRQKNIARYQAQQKALLTALDALEAKWDHPQKFSDKPDAWEITGYNNTGKKDKSSDYLGKVTLLLFLDGFEVESSILPEAQVLQSEGLEVVVITPGRPKPPKPGQKEASVEAGLRILLPQIPQKAKFLSDPYGVVRCQLNLFSTPAVLFDKKGRIIWRTRIGQRETPDDTTEFRKAVRLALANKILEEKPSNKTNIFRPKETEIFGFENGWEGWTVEGDAWNPEDETIQGPSSERHIPGLVAGFLGRHWLSSFAGKIAEGTGVATSPEFKISAPYLHFLAGGGDIPQNAGLILQLLPEETYVRTFTPLENTYELKPATWDVSAFIGKTARIIAYDNSSKEYRDGIMADAFTLSDSPKTPEAFAQRHDPNNPEHVERVAVDFPELWKELQAGNFHQEFTPGWSFDIERTIEMEKLTERPPYQFENIAISEETPIQEASNQKLEILVDEIPGTSKNVPLGNTVYIKEMLTAENKRQGKNVKIRLSAHINTKNGTFKLEKPPIPPTPPIELQSNASGAHIPLETVEFFKERNLLRHEAEEDHTYILRIWRYIQRYYIGWSNWGGWPIDKTGVENTKVFAGLGTQHSKELWEQLSGLENVGFKSSQTEEVLTTKSADCPAVIIFELLSQLGGIPTIAGQGLWINREVEGKDLPHARVLVFLKSSGWILLDDDKIAYTPYGQFSNNHKTGDNYFQYTNEPIIFPYQKNLRMTEQQNYTAQWITKKAEQITTEE